MGSMHMERIYLTPQRSPVIKDRMPRRKVFERRLNLPITEALLARIDAVLHSDMGEVRVGFIRTAVEQELKRRELAASRQPKKGRK
jgi:hypothetical protein